MEREELRKKDSTSAPYKTEDKKMKTDGSRVMALGHPQVNTTKLSFRPLPSLPPQIQMMAVPLRIGSNWKTDISLGTKLGSPHTVQYEEEKSLTGKEGSDSDEIESDDTYGKARLSPDTSSPSPPYFVPTPFQPRQQQPRKAYW